jgi:hypothetical protein
MEVQSVLGSEAGYSPSSSAEVTNVRSYTSTPAYVFLAWRLIKHRDNLNTGVWQIQI